VRLGIAAKTFARSSAEEAFDAIAGHGLAATQLNLADPALAPRVGAAARSRGVEIAAVSGTFNMAHPDERQRAAGLRRLDLLASSCRDLGTAVITLCTGTRDADDMWRRHPANATAEAWEDMRATVVRAVEIADRHGVTLAIEPERANVIDGPAAARRLLDELRSPRLRIVIDAANLFDADEPALRLARSRHVLTHAVELLGDDIVLAHAKDVRDDGVFVAAGRGGVDWELYVRLLDEAGFDGALILHGLAESEVAGSVARCRDALGRIGSEVTHG
jgi:sugar phosphate isomerase/epimerase